MIFYYHKLNRSFLQLIAVFLIPLSIGFYLGLSFVDHTTQMKPTGIVENYLGNEHDENAEEMKFKKSEHEIINILHTHFLSLSVIFFIVAILLGHCTINQKLKKFLMIEPLISVIVTFGGIYFLWLGYEWMTYIIILSGTLMTISFFLSVILIYRQIYLVY